MFLTILKKDLRRKKVMNTVLLILIILASTLAASSSSLMYSTSSALGSFIEASKVADLNITLANDPVHNSAVEDWVKQEKKVETAYTERQLNLFLNQVKMPEGRKSFAGNVSFVLSAIPEQVNLVFGEDNERYSLRPGRSVFRPA